MKFSLVIKSLPIQFLLITCFALDGYGQTVLKGEILNYDGKSLVGYYPTTEGVHPTYWKTVKPNEKGRFKIKLENENLATARVYFHHTMYRFLYGNDNELVLRIDQNKLKRPTYKYDYGKKEQFIRDSLRRAGLVEIGGDYKEINHYYNSVMRTAYGAFPVTGTTHSHLIRNAKIPLEVNLILDSMINVEVDMINNLGRLVDEGDDDEYLSTTLIKDFLRNEVRAYYAGVFINGMFVKRSDQLNILEKDSTTALDIYNTQWVNLTKDFLKNISGNVRPSTESIEFNQLLIALPYLKREYRNFERVESKKTLNEIVIQQLIYPDTSFYNTEKTKLALRLYDLKIFLNSQTFYSPTLLNTFYELQKIYPDSPNLAYFEPQIEKLKEFIDKSTKDFVDGQIVKTNYSSFEDLIGEFKGTPIFIDVWATWCHPCIEQFQYKKPLEEYCNKNDITMLYVSIDKPSFKERWRQNIKYNELKGYHVRANNELISSMWEYLEGFKGAIPRYAIIDKNGGLEVSEAARPESLEELLAQLESVR
ncbi:MAG: redoxin family protein [Bacteroidota bacterium]